MRNKKTRGAVSFCLLILAILLPEVCLSSEATRQLWNSLKQPDHFAFIRHAIAPGTGDPPEFALSECQTQRNLSDEGRRQAKRISEQFHQNGISQASVFSSQWCRCMETARLLELGKVVELPAINSFFREYQKGYAQTAQLKQWLGNQDLQGVTVLVTHQVNITALSGVYPASGEIIIVRRKLPAPAEFEVVGTIKID
ncbi:histidine phosphatase family protein [Desulfosediminicola sp.]|uniref:histidine phosphatase family protein n=1 Tax=Desulfosediminicola sp. TaxID=2886825 RepID=UPI003AF25EFB